MPIIKTAVNFIGLGAIETGKNYLENYLLRLKLTGQLT